MNFSDYMIKRLKNGNFRSLHFYGDGGIGKTTSLYRLYSAIHEQSLCCKGKKIVPLYIPLNQIHLDETTTVNAICSYIWTEYTDQPVDSYFNDNFRRLLNTPDSEFHYLILCDGINETAFASTLNTEISMLLSQRNTTLCIASRQKNDISSEWNDELDLIHASSLSSNTVRRCIPENLSLDDETLSILQNPFYLTKWLQLSSEDKDGAQSFNRGQLISSYFDWLQTRFKKENSTQMLKFYSVESEERFNLTFNDALGYALVFLAALAFEMHTENCMYVSIGDKCWKNACAGLPVKIKYDMNYIFDYTSVSTENQANLFDTFYVPMGLFYAQPSPTKSRKNTYYFSHQNYRDYLAAMNIYNIAVNMDRTISTVPQCTKQVLDLFANVFYDTPYMFRKDGTPCIPNDKFISELNLDRMEAFDTSNISVFGFILINCTELLRNGSIEKTRYCESICPMGNRVIRFMQLKYEDGSLTFDSAVYDVFRTQAEILRRCHKYDSAIKLLEYLVHMINASETPKMNQAASSKNILAKAENGLAKCILLQAFESAQEHGKEIDKETLHKYQQAVAKLKELADLPYTPSSNLYSRLLATPDPISANYLAMIWDNISTESRCLDAFRYNWRAACHNYDAKDEVSKTMRIYPLRQIITALFSKEGSFMCTDDDCYDDIINNKPYTELMIGYENIAVVPYSAEHAQIDSHMVFIIISYVESLSKSEAALLHAKRMIFDGADIPSIAEVLRKSQDSLLTSFLLSALDDNGKNQLILLSRAKQQLLKRMTSRTPDAYDAIYIQNDIRELWDLIKGTYNPAYSDEFMTEMDNILNMDLQPSH